MDSKDFQKRFEEAYKLLTQETTNREKFESVRELIKGFNPKVDLALEKVSSALSDVEKLEKGELIELGAENLPENTEEEKKKKKAIMTLIRFWKDLTLEVERVKQELQENKGTEKEGKKIESFSRIAKFAKGPFGIITIAAVVIAAVVGVLGLQKTPSQEINIDKVNETSTEQKIKVIVVGDKRIPLTEVHTGIGTECENQEHYHANTNNMAMAVDGTNVSDPGGCGYGKVEEIKIEEVEL